jgi:hypothetical protein
MGHLQGQVDTLGMSQVGTGATPGPGVQEDDGTPTTQKGQGNGHRRTWEDQRGIGGTDQEGQVTDLILAAFRRFGTSTPDTWIAREVGCSRKTVGRWKKRLLEQGLLSASPADEATE